MLVVCTTYLLYVHFQAEKENIKFMQKMSIYFLHFSFKKHRIFSFCFFLNNFYTKPKHELSGRARGIV